VGQGCGGPSFTVSSKDKTDELLWCFFDCKKMTAVASECSLCTLALDLYYLDSTVGRGYVRSGTDLVSHYS